MLREAGLDVAGANLTHSDGIACLTEFDAQALGEGPHRMLGGPVEPRSGRHSLAGHGADVDDLPRDAPASHAGDRLAGAETEAEDVDFEHLLPVCSNTRSEAPGMAQARVVDQHIDTTKLLCRRKQLFHRVLITDVAPHRQRCLCCGIGGGEDLCDPFVAAAAADHSHPCGDQPSGDRCTDATADAGHHRSFSSPPLHAVRRRGCVHGIHLLCLRKVVVTAAGYGERQPRRSSMSVVGDAVETGNGELVRRRVRERGPHAARRARHSVFLNRAA